MISVKLHSKTLVFPRHLVDWKVKIWPIDNGPKRRRNSFRIIAYDKKIGFHCKTRAQTASKWILWLHMWTEFIVGTLALSTIAYRYQRIIPTQRGQICCSCTRDYDHDRIHSIQDILSLYGWIMSPTITSDHQISLRNDFIPSFHEPTAVTNLFWLQHWYCFCNMLSLITSYTAWTNNSTKYGYLQVKKVG